MIVLGADMHKRSHTIAAVGATTGELLSEKTVQVAVRGFGALLVWAAVGAPDLALPSPVVVELLERIAEIGGVCSFSCDRSQASTVRAAATTFSIRCFS